MFDVQLTAALKKEECPLCHLRQKAEARYVFHSLWENVADATFRQRFLASEGLCPTHAWQLQETEESMWHDGLKTGILYESLLAVVRHELLSAGKQSSRPWWHPINVWRRFLPLASPVADGCPVCRIGESTADFYAGELAGHLAKPAWQTAYENSAGLCLPHLRLTLGRSNDVVRGWLLAEVDTRLELLQQALSEYVRKHAWQYRDEPVSAAERQSWIKAVAFLRGAKCCNQENHR